MLHYLLEVHNNLIVIIFEFIIRQISEQLEYFKVHSVK